MSTKIAVVGSNMVDLITYTDRMPNEGETLEAPSFAMGFGGKGANQAVAAAKLGADVMMVTKVGDDMFGPNTKKNLADNGIDTRYVETVPGVPSGVAPIFVEPNGSNSILIVKGANAHLKPADIDRVADDLKQCAIIVMQLEIPVETIYHVLNFGKTHGIDVLLNPAPAQADLDMKEVCKATFLVPNESELQILSGMPVTTREEAEAAAKSLVDKGVQQVIVTLGENGVLLVEAGRALHIDCPKVEAKDTTGAGDAFIGCFVSTYVRSRDLVASLEDAARYASDSITRLGTQSSYATAEQFEQFKATLG